MELAIRTAMIKLGGGLLEELLGLDAGHRGAQVSCPGGHLSRFCDPGVQLRPPHPEPRSTACASAPSALIGAQHARALSPRPEITDFRT